MIQPLVTKVNTPEQIKIRELIDASNKHVISMATKSLIAGDTTILSIGDFDIPLERKFKTIRVWDGVSDITNLLTFTLIANTPYYDVTINSSEAYTNVEIYITW